MSRSETSMATRQKALDNGAKRYTIVLGPEFATIVNRQKEIWGSDVETFRQALLALEANTSSIVDPSSGQTFAIDSDHLISLTSAGDKVLLSFQKGDAD